MGPAGDPARAAARVGLATGGGGGGAVRRLRPLGLLERESAGVPPPGHLRAVVTVLGLVAMRGKMYPRYLFLLVGFAILIVVRGAMVLGALLARLGNFRRTRRSSGKRSGSGAWCW